MDSTATSVVKTAPIGLPGGVPRRVSILGSTGSIGCSTIDLILRSPDKFQVATLTAFSNVARLAEQARKTGAERAVIGDAALYGALKEALSGTNIDISAGTQAIVEAAEAPSDFVMAGIVGAAATHEIGRAHV